MRALRTPDLSEWLEPGREFPSCPTDEDVLLDLDPAVADAVFKTPSPVHSLHNVLLRDWDEESWNNGRCYFAGADYKVLDGRIGGETRERSQSSGGSRATDAACFLFYVLHRVVR